MNIEFRKVCPFDCRKRRKRRKLEKRFFLFSLHPFDATDITQRLINFIYSVCYVRWARGCPRQHICSKYLKNR